MTEVVLQFFVPTIILNNLAFHSIPIRLGLSSTVIFFLLRIQIEIIFIKPVGFFFLTFTLPLSFLVYTIGGDLLPMQD